MNIWDGLISYLKEKEFRVSWSWKFLSFKEIIDRRNLNDKKTDNENTREKDNGSMET